MKVVGVTVELVVLVLDPTDVTSTVLAGIPVLDSVEDIVVVEVLVSLMISVTR